jgi:hypothetical protein
MAVYTGNGSKGCAEHSFRKARGQFIILFFGNYWYNDCIYSKPEAMSVIIIKADNRSNKILKELAKHLGANVVNLNGVEYGDILLGAIMDPEKTGKDATKDEIMKKLKRK